MSGSSQAGWCHPNSISGSIQNTTDWSARMVDFLIECVPQPPPPTITITLSLPIEQRPKTQRKKKLWPNEIRARDVCVLRTTLQPGLFAVCYRMWYKTFYIKDFFTVFLTKRARKPNNNQNRGWVSIIAHKYQMALAHTSIHTYIHTYRTEHNARKCCSSQVRALIESSKCDNLVWMERHNDSSSGSSSSSS